MQHLQIAYELGVIMIGFASLAMAGFWAIRTREAYLRDFCVVYALFTVLLILSVAMNYLALNVAGYTGRVWYAISGAGQVVNFAIIAATIHFLLGVFQVRYRKVLSLFFLALMVICVVLIFSPAGAVLAPDENTIRFGWGFQLASVFYFLSFTFLLVLGFVLYRRVWRTEKQTFILGLLLFASVGYVESFFSLIATLRSPAAVRAAQDSFLFSSIPYALYGVFLIYYFFRYYVSPPPLHEGPTEAFLRKYGITDREREVILKVIEGKSNADIASELVISLATVKTHLHNIYTKTGVDSRYDLLARVRSGQ